MPYWIKINYDRNDYIIDLDRISAFCCTGDIKITFWLPDSSQAIIINKYSNAENYEQIFEHLQNLKLINSDWMQIIYERNEYLINLARLSSFAHSPSGKITFWLPDSHIPIIINKVASPDIYNQVLTYIEKLTNNNFSDDNESVNN